MVILLGISPKNLNLLGNYMGALQSHLWKKVILFKIKIVDKACVQAQYLENIGYKKGWTSGSK